MTRTFLLCTTLLLLITAAPHSQAQNHNRYKGKGRTEIVGDTRVEELVQKHIAFNEQAKTIPGYRIQIASLSGNNSRTQAFQKKDQFKSTFPEVEAYVMYIEPNFRVVVGDFITRLDAYLFLQKCKNLFPGNIVKDDIYPIRLNWSDIVPETDEDANH